MLAAVGQSSNIGADCLALIGTRSDRVMRSAPLSERLCHTGSRLYRPWGRRPLALRHGDHHAAGAGGGHGAMVLDLHRRNGYGRLAIVIILKLIASDHRWPPDFARSFFASLFVEACLGRPPPVAAVLALHVVGGSGRSRVSNADGDGDGLGVAIVGGPLTMSFWCSDDAQRRRHHHRRRSGGMHRYQHLRPCMFGHSFFDLASYLRGETSASPMCPSGCASHPSAHDAPPRRKVPTRDDRGPPARIRAGVSGRRSSWSTIPTILRQGLFRNFFSGELDSHRGTISGSRTRGLYPTSRCCPDDSRPR